MVSLICACGATLSADATPLNVPALLLAHVRHCPAAVGGVVSFRCDGCGQARRFGPGVSAAYCQSGEDVRARLIQARDDQRWLLAHRACAGPP